MTYHKAKCTKCKWESSWIGSGHDDKVAKESAAFWTRPEEWHSTLGYTPKLWQEEWWKCYGPVELLTTEKPY